MIRTHESPIAIRAGALSVLVHIVLLVIFLVSFNWKTVQTASIAEVELWDSLPSPAPAVKPEPPKPEPVIEPEPPKPEPVVEPEPPKPEPVIEPKPEPQPEPKAEIQLKKGPVKEPVKPKPKEKPKVEKPKVDPAIAKKAEEERLKKIKELQQMVLEDQPQHQANAAQEASNKAAQAASAGEINEYKNRIASKIKGYVNPQLCGSDKVELKFKIALLPTGQLAGNPKLIKSSGIPACDQAVERAILQAEPLPLPEQPDLRAQFRDIELPFYPNDR